MSDSASDRADRLMDYAAALKSGQKPKQDRRARDRIPLDAPVVLRILTPDGHVLPPMELRAKDISSRGMCVVSRNMIYVDAIGAARMRRSDGRFVVVGVRVRHCRYVGRMSHETGLEFIPVPAELAMTEYMEGERPGGRSGSQAA